MLQVSIQEGRSKGDPYGYHVASDAVAFRYCVALPLHVDIPELEAKARCLRRRVFDICVKAGTGHITSCFSCVEILVALYYGGVMRPGDKFILSKGHASPLLYAILADLGYFPEEELETFCQPGSRLGVHLNDEVPGVECISGSLGYGLGIAAGLAYADRSRRVFCLLGDAECQEGSVWEAAMFAGKHRLSNLTAIIDCNGYGATPSNRPTVTWRWDTLGWSEWGRLNGHDIGKLIGALSFSRLGPGLFKAKTVKGKGVSFLIDAPLMHGCVPTDPQQIEQARRELSA